MTMTSDQPSQSEPVDELTADSSVSTDDDIASSASSLSPPPPPHATTQPLTHMHDANTAHHAIHTTADTVAMVAHFQPSQLHSPHTQPLLPSLASPFSAMVGSAVPFDGAVDGAFPLSLPPGLDGVMRDLSSLSISSQPPHYQQQHHQQQQQQQLLALQQYMVQQQHMQQLAAAAYIYNLHCQQSQQQQQHHPLSPQHAHTAMPATHYPLPYPHMADQHIHAMLASPPAYPTVPISPYLTSSASAPSASALSPLSPTLSSASSPLSSTSSSSSAIPSAPFPRTKLIVRYLPPTLSPTAFHSLFQPFGRLLSSNLIMSRSQPQMSLCYGFLLYTTEAEARECRRHMNGRRIEGRVIEVEECKGGKEGRNGEKRVIRITGWRGRPSEADVRQRCEVYGEVESVAVTADESSTGGGSSGGPAGGASAGIGEVSVIVKFAQSASAYRCIEAMHNAHIGDTSGGTAAATASTTTAGGSGGSVSVKFHDAAHRGRQSHRLNSIGRTGRGGGGGSAGGGMGVGVGNSRAPRAQRSAPPRRAQDGQWTGSTASMWSMDGALPNQQLHHWSAAAAAAAVAASAIQQQQQQGEVADMSAGVLEGQRAVVGAPSFEGGGGDGQ